MKHEWRKKEKNIYIPKQKPEIIKLQPMKYISIEGKGNPGSEEFSNCVQALYNLSYPIKMTLKGERDDDYTVYPLEGFWNFNDEGIRLYKEGKKVTELKDYLVYKVMIRQPDYVTDEFYNKIKEEIYNKKKNEYILKTKYEVIEEGTVCQMLHVGSYDSEPESFNLMEQYCIQNGYERSSKEHKEIYLSNPQRVEPEKLKTTIRFKVTKK